MGGLVRTNLFSPSPALTHSRLRKSFLTPRFAVFFAILLLGVCSQIVQPLLIRESLVVFYGNEVSLG